MVRAIISGRKSQTRRLLRSPLAKVLPGDRLWARETWQHAPQRYCTCPQYSEPSPCDDWSNGTGCRSNRSGAVYRADGGEQRIPWRSPIFCPRWASRITLEVTTVRVERLGAISEADAVAEGLVRLSKDGGQTWKWGVPEADGMPGPGGQEWKDWSVDPCKAYAALWSSLHAKPGDRWEDNPMVAVISFADCSR